MINKQIRVDGMHLRGTWNHELPRVAPLTVRFSGGGNPKELIEDENIGIVRLNRWPAELQGQVRYLSTLPSKEDPPGYRVIRFEASLGVVARIQKAGGTLHIGRSKGTVQSNKKPVKQGSNVTFRLQNPTSLR